MMLDDGRDEQEPARTKVKLMHEYLPRAERWPTLKKALMICVISLCPSGLYLSTSLRLRVDNFGMPVLPSCARAQ